MNERIMLTRNNQFGPTGPQAGDLGTAESTFFVPNIDVRWYRVVFDEYDDGIFSVPEAAIEIIDY